MGPSGQDGVRQICQRDIDKVGGGTEPDLDGTQGEVAIGNQDDEVRATSGEDIGHNVRGNGGDGRRPGALGLSLEEDMDALGGEGRQGVMRMAQHGDGGRSENDDDVERGAAPAGGVQGGIRSGGGEGGDREGRRRRRRRRGGRLGQARRRERYGRG